MDTKTKTLTWVLLQVNAFLQSKAKGLLVLRSYGFGFCGVDRGGTIFLGDFVNEILISESLCEFP